MVAGSLSKTYAMTGWRVGFALAPAPIIGAMMKLQSHSTSNPTSICAESRRRSHAWSAGFRSRDAGRIPPPPRFRDRAAARDSGRFDRDAQGRFLRLSEHQRAPTAAPVKNSLEFATELLAEAHVAVVPGEAFGTNDHVRISYATSMKELERGLDRIHKFIDGLRA